MEFWSESLVLEYGVEVVEREHGGTYLSGKVWKERGISEGRVHVIFDDLTRRFLFLTQTTSFFSSFFDAIIRSR